MKKTILLFLLGCMLNVPIYAQNINFSDANVKAICIANWDANSDGELSETEAAAVTSLGTVFKNNIQITSFDELQYFTGLTQIPMDAFYQCTGLTSIIIPDNVSTIGSWAFYYCTSLNNVTLPNSLEIIGSHAFCDCEKLPIPPLPISLITIGSCAFGYMGTPYPEAQDIVIPDLVTSIGTAAFYGRKIKSVILGHSLEIIGENAFYGSGNKLDEIRIPRSVTSIGALAFFSNSNSYPRRVIVENEIPFNITSDSFRTGTGGAYNYKKLYVPIGSKTAYEAAEYWQDFKEIIEMKETVSISSAGMGTFCSAHPLDFSGTDDVKAYIVSAFKPSTGEVTLTRITDVPANTGIVVKGDADTYSIPWGAGETVVANMLVGVTENTVLNKVNGDYTNYILAKKNGNLGFYAVSDGSTLSAGKAYLPLPTAQLPSNAGARQMTMIFEDETTGIQQNISRTELSSDYYDLQGRHVSMPTRGLYIVNGKKVVIK